MPAAAVVPPAVLELGRRAKAASRALGLASTATKDEALTTAADLLESRTDELLAANAADLEAAAAGGMAATPLDRLRLTPARVACHGRRPAPGRPAARPRR